MSGAPLPPSGAGRLPVCAAGILDMDRVIAALSGGLSRSWRVSLQRGHVGLRRSHGNRAYLPASNNSHITVSLSGQTMEVQTVTRASQGSATAESTRS